MSGVRALLLLTTMVVAGCQKGPAGVEAGAGGTGWPRLSPPASLNLDEPLRAGFLIVDGVYNSELIAPYDILHHTPFHTDPRPGVEVFTVSPDGRPVTTFEGLIIDAHHSFDDAPPIDILVVPSAEHSMDTDLTDERLMRWVRERGARAAFVVSLCDGAFVLANAGLLDGRAATTFPGDQDRFQEMFPGVDLRRAPSFVHDGGAITSHGGARSYDPALYLVHLLYGEKAAAGVARGLVLEWPPPPGTSAASGVVVAR
ncbi:MAG: DJ-1/PfpI family protein [Acidobacteriota bacterium]|nr:DJ-1/PfpI family protein [Acidobacteriota bacterium]